MGNILDKIKEQQEANEKDTLEKLQTVHKLMVDKVAATSTKLQNEAIEDKSLPIVSVVDKSQQYKVQVSSAPDPQVTGAIGQLLSGNFLAGLTSLIKVALNEFLGNTSAGESEKVDFHVIYANNSLLRIDYMLYKYEFASSGLKRDYQNAFCYYMQVGVLDLEKVNPQILLYELTRAIGEDNLPTAAKHLQGLAIFAKELYSTIHQLKNASLGDGSGSGGSSGGTPPKPNPPTPGEGNEGGEEGGEGEGFEFGGKDKEGSCKPSSFAMLPALEDIAQGAQDQGKEEYRRTEEFGVIVVEQAESKIQSS